MTFRKKLAKEHPRQIKPTCGGGCEFCPSDYGYEPERSQEDCDNISCKECWDREIPEDESESKKAAEIGKHVVEGIKDAMFISDIYRVLMNADRFWSISYNPSTGSYNIYIEEKEE